MEVTGGWSLVEMGSYCLIGMDSVQDDEQVVEVDSGNCTTS